MNMYNGHIFSLASSLHDEETLAVVSQLVIFTLLIRILCGTRLHALKTSHIYLCTAIFRNLPHLNDSLHLARPAQGVIILNIKLTL